MIDGNQLIGEVNAYAGREVLFTGGTVANLGQIRHVTGSSATSRSIGWGIALPAETAAGDEAELINARGIGFRFQDIHDAINRAIRSIATQALVPTGSDTAVYARGDGIAIPAEFKTVEGLQWQSAADPTVWHAIARAPRVNGHGWYVDRASRTVVLAGNPARAIDGRTVKLWGLAEPAELHDDDDETEVDYEYLVASAQATLARAKYLRIPTQETERVMFMLQQQGAATRRRAVTRRSPFSVEV